MRLTAVLLLVLAPMVHADTGLDFPDNASTNNNNASSPRFKWVNPHTNGLPIYGPNGQGVTYIWEYYPRQQTGYYTTLFWANDDGAGTVSDTFLWTGGGGADTYYGAHPYPPSGSGGTTHEWEISVEQDDYTNGTVVKGRWYTQAFVVWEDGSGYKHHEFYWDLPNTDSGHKVTRTSPQSWGEQNPPSPALTWGDAPWQPGRELGHGIHRGIRIYNKRLAESDILSEATAPLSTAEGAANVWYLNMNPTPTDISDKSGQGHNPVWVSGARPVLWTDGQSQVATPIIQPNGGTFVGSVVISMSTTTTGASIYYTTDGGDPTQSSILYTVPITLTADTTVRARGFKSGMDASDVSTASFTITQDTTPPSVFSVTASGDPNVVRVLYSEPVEETSAEDVGNYGIDHGVGISSATLQPDTVTVLLSTSTLSEGISYTLTVNDVRDRADPPNTVDPNTQVAFEYVALLVPDGLIGYWRFDDGGGTIAADSSPNGNDGTVQGAAWTSGHTAGALDFDGNDDYVDLGGLDVAGSGLSIVMWFKADDYSPSDVRLCSKSTGTSEQDHYWMLSAIDGPNLRFRLKTNGTTSTLVAGSGTLSLGVWTHAVATYDGSAMRLYRDGVPVGSLNKTGSVSTNSGVAAWIGRNPDGYGAWDGSIDEVRIYDRGLNEDEIATLFSGAPGDPPDPPQPPANLVIQ